MLVKFALSLNVKCTAKIWAGIRYAMHYGKVELNTVEYTMAFLNSDWLPFLWHGIKMGTGKFNAGGNPAVD